MFSDFDIVPCSQEHVLMAFFIGRGFNVVNSLLFLVSLACLVFFLKRWQRFNSFFHRYWDPVNEQLIESPAHLHTNALVYPCDCWRQDPYGPAVLIICSSSSAVLRCAFWDLFTDSCFMSHPSHRSPGWCRADRISFRAWHQQPCCCP